MSPAFYAHVRCAGCSSHINTDCDEHDVFNGLTYCGQCVEGDATDRRLVCAICEIPKGEFEISGERCIEEHDDGPGNSASPSGRYPRPARAHEWVEEAS